MTIGEKIRFLRVKNGLSQETLAKSLKTTKQAIYKYENGIVTNIPLEKIEILSSILNTTPAYLMGWEEEGTPSDPLRVPVLGKVAAGIPIEAIEEILDYEELSPDMARDGSEYFALQIKGSSMEPRISDGDVVIVRKQPDVDSGQIAIVCVNGDEATCKKIMKQDTGILLLPLNPTFAPTFYSNEDIERIPITILGRVVELRAKF